MTNYECWSFHCLILRNLFLPGLSYVKILLLNSIESVSTRMVVVSFNSCLLDSVLAVMWSILIEINFNPIWYILTYVCHGYYSFLIPLWVCMSVRFSSLKVGLWVFEPGTVLSTRQHSTNFTNSLYVTGFWFPLYTLHYPNTLLWCSLTAAPNS